MRLGIMGGTFDPIHNGHLFVAEEARVLFKLDHILFVPNGDPPHKKDYEITSAVHRLTMAQIAIRNNPEFACTDIEMNRPGPSYTVDTLALLQDQYPDAILYYITGIDAVAEILSWKRHEEVIRAAYFITATRPGYELELLQNRLPSEYLQRILPIGSTALDISSTDMRSRVADGLPIRYLTPDGVVTYIYRHGLYTAKRQQCFDPVIESGDKA